MVRILLTDIQRQREKLEDQVYKERQKLLLNKRSSVMAIDANLMAKYKIGSRSTIWKMCKRYEARHGIGTAYGDDDSRAE